MGEEVLLILNDDNIITEMSTRSTDRGGPIQQQSETYYKYLSTGVAADKIAGSIKDTLLILTHCYRSTD